MVTALATSDKPAPIHVEVSRPAPTATADSSAAPSSTNANEEPPKKKRGFWSRVFRVGKDKEENDKARQQ
jgi:hypothetical protein